MNAFRLIQRITLLLTFIAPAVYSGEPIRLHPDNPHYFLYQNQPTVLVTSGEHYGAVLNLDFDYERYLDAMQADGMNLTRVFSGVYCEKPGEFKIEKNTLAPYPLRFLSPWARSSEPGYAVGGNKFDLTQWDAKYFERLHQFMKYADRRGVVVEYVLFCPMYNDGLWEICPMNQKNNVNSIGAVNKNEVYALKEAKLTEAQVNFVKKAVNELNPYGNLYFEICNEPYFGGVTLDFQRDIAKTITDEEANLPNKHLIAQNIANGSQTVTDPDPNVSILNYHYAYPPDAVSQNYRLDRAIGYDESGFAGDSDVRYRTHAWAFLLAGGAEFNNLDYSFTIDCEDGTASQEAPGGGSPALRKQLKVLHDFVNGFDFIRMNPEPELVSNRKPGGLRTWVLAQEGKTYAVYLYMPNGERIEATLTLKAPAGRYAVEWVSTIDGKVVRSEKTESNGEITLKSPAFVDDAALKLTRED
ncbi:MAG: hypothetical protein GC154_00175 [bacterium]|nr:hypothetical protein [bacterium]